MILPKKIRAHIVNKNWINEKVIKTDFKYIEPQNVEFLPGQFVNMHVDNVRYRAYSFCSDYKDTTGFSLIIEAAHIGAGSNFIREAKIGDEVNFIGPSGRFLLRETVTNTNEVVFLATGTGIAPFIPMIQKLKDTSFTGHIKLRFGSRTKKQTLFDDLLAQYKTEFSNFDYEIYLSQEKLDGYKEGRITQNLSDLVSNNTQYYICGNPNMVKEAIEKLLSFGVSIENIGFEEYTVAGN